LESSGHEIYRKTPWTQELKRNMRKNMKIPREKEKPEQPVIISRITRLPAWFESTRSNQAEEMKVVMNRSIARFRTRGSPRWREKTMMTTCSRKPDIPLSELLYLLQYPWIEVYISWL
jgi:hypothetical protein